MIRAVFFDLDGTLLDTAADLAAALNKLLVIKNKQTISELKIREVVSDGAYAMLKLAFGVDRDHPDTPALRQQLLDLYGEDLSSKTRAFSGIETLIEQFDKHNIIWGIVTNKPRAYAAPLMENFTFACAPVCLICPDDVKQRKPHPEALERACTLANCTPDEALYIGDHIRDIQCGQRAKMKTIAVSYGYIAIDDSASDWGADYVVDDPEQLWPIIQALD